METLKDIDQESMPTPLIIDLLEEYDGAIGITTSGPYNNVDGFDMD